MRSRKILGGDGLDLVSVVRCEIAQPICIDFQSVSSILAGGVARCVDLAGARTCKKRVMASFPSHQGATRYNRNSWARILAGVL